jgi:hypothetical protein
MGCPFGSGSDGKKYMCGTTSSEEERLEVERFIDPDGTRYKGKRI